MIGLLLIAAVGSIGFSWFRGGNIDDPAPARRIIHWRPLAALVVSPLLGFLGFGLFLFSGNNLRDFVPVVVQLQVLQILVVLFSHGAIIGIPPTAIIGIILGKWRCAQWWTYLLAGALYSVLFAVLGSARNYSRGYELFVILAGPLTGGIAWLARRPDRNWRPFMEGTT